MLSNFTLLSLTAISVRFNELRAVCPELRVQGGTVRSAQASFPCEALRHNDRWQLYLLIARRKQSLLSPPAELGNEKIELCA